MANVYDLAIAKMELAKTLALEAYNSAENTGGAEANVQLLNNLFKQAYESVIRIVGPTIVESIVPGPEESEKI